VAVTADTARDALFCVNDLPDTATEAQLNAARVVLADLFPEAAAVEPPAGRPRRGRTATAAAASAQPGEDAAGSSVPRIVPRITRFNFIVDDANPVPEVEAFVQSGDAELSPLPGPTASNGRPGTVGGSWCTLRQSATKPPDPSDFKQGFFMRQ